MQKIANPRYVFTRNNFRYGPFSFMLITSVASKLDLHIYLVRRRNFLNMVMFILTIIRLTNINNICRLQLGMSSFHTTVKIVSYSREDKIWEDWTVYPLLQKLCFHGMFWLIIRNTLNYVLYTLRNLKAHHSIKLKKFSLTSEDQRSFLIFC